MPFLEDPAPVTPRRSGGFEPPPEKPAPSFDVTLGAAFSRESTIGSAIDIMGQEYEFPPDPDFNPFKDPTFSKSTYALNYGDRFINVRSRMEAEAISQQIDRELERDKLLESAGFAGTVASIGMGILASPETLLPGGAVYRSARTGQAVARSALSVAAAGGAGAAIQEMNLQGTQLTRTTGESVAAVAGGVVLGGILGGGVGLLSAKQLRRMEMEITGQAPFETRVVPIGGGMSSVGAAAVEAADTTLVNRLGSGAFAKFSAFMTPLLRMQTSEAGASRAAAAKLADPAGMRFAANTEEGGNRALIEGGPVESRVRSKTDAQLARFHEELDEVYAAYWKEVTGQEGLAARTAQLQNAARKELAGGVDGPMTPREFFERVGRAIHTDDAASADEFTKRAAAVVRSHLNDVLKMVPEGQRPDVSAGPKFAGGYLPSIFNPQAIAARAQEFEEKIFANMKSDQERKALLQGQAQSARGEMKALTKRERKLAARAETAKRRLAEVNARLDEAGMFETRANRRADTAFDREKAMQAEIKDLEDQIAAAKGDRDYTKADVANLEKELAVLRKAMDKALKASKEMPEPAPVQYDNVPANLGYQVRMPRVVDYVIGNRPAPKEFGFIDWIIKQGGVKDTGGDIRAMFDGKPPKGLINENGKQIDDLAQNLAEWYGRRDRDEFDILDLIDNAGRGENPPGWRETLSDEMQQRLREYDTAQDIRYAMQEAGINPRNKSDVVNFITGGTPDELGGVVGRTVGPQDGVRGADDPFGDLGAIPLDPVENYRGMADLTGASKGDLKRAERVVNSLREKIIAAQKSGARKTGSADEAAVNATAARSRMEILLDRAERAAAADKQISDEMASLAKSKTDVRARLEKIVTEWEGDTTRAAKSALKARAQQEAERLAVGTSKGSERLTGADTEVDRAIRSIVKSERGLSDAELRQQARDVVTNMIATPDGRLPYEWGSSAAKQNRAGMVGDGLDVPFLKERKMPIHRAEILDFMETDVRAVFHAYAHSMISQAEMARMFDGDVSGTGAIRAIQEDYGRMIAAATTEKERLALQKAMNNDIRDFQAMRDRILGVYGLPADPNSLFHRAATVARNFNFMSRMGMMVVSSVSDAGMMLLRHGFGRTFEALGAALSRFSKDPSMQKLSKLERDILADSGLGLEMTLGHRQMSFAEIATDLSRVSKFERGVRAATAGFSYLNGSRLWDTSMQTVAGIATMRRMMRNIEAWATKGAIPKGEAEWMASLNIGQEQAKRIWATAAAGDGERVKGVLIPEGRTWSDPDAYEMFRVALKQSVDSTILKPGQDKPLWMSTTTGKVIGQFRSFMISAHQRILLSGMQQADANMASGAVTMVALGMVSVALSDLARDGKLKDREPGEWFVEGFDRSGIGGWLMEANNVAEKISGQQFGLRPLGGQEPAARTINQSKADVVLGPTLGFVADATRVAGVPFKLAADAVKGEFSPMNDQITRGDVRAVFNQIPGQNLFWFRGAMNKLRESTEDALGLERPKPKAN